MNPAVVFQTTTRFVTPLLLLFSVYMLLRGHNEPGGGFIGGLLAATAFTLYGLAFDVLQAKRLLRVSPHTLVGLGLTAAVGSGLVGLLIGQPFMYALWVPSELPTGLKVGTVLLFDIGIYLVVLGAVLLFILTLYEDT